MRNLKTIVVTALCLLMGSVSVMAGSINTSSAPRHVNEGKRWLDLNEPERAIMSTKKALDMNELDPMGMALAFNNMCVAHFRLGEYMTAKSYCDKALKIDKSDHRFHVNLGNAYWGLDRLDLAIAEYNKALELEPESQDARYNLELAHKKLREAQIGAGSELATAAPDS